MHTFLIHLITTMGKNGFFSGRNPNPAAGKLYDVPGDTAKAEFARRFGFDAAITRNENLVTVLTDPPKAIGQVDACYKDIVVKVSHQYNEMYQQMVKLGVPANVAQEKADQACIGLIKHEKFLMSLQYPFIMNGDAGSNPFANMVSGNKGLQTASMLGGIGGNFGSSKRKRKHKKAKHA